jgi:hypothetical protein
MLSPIIWELNKGKVFNIFIGGTSAGTSLANLHLGYRSSNTITQAHWGGVNDFDKSIPSFSSAISAIHSFVFSQNDGKAIYTNGGAKVVNNTQKNSLISYVGSRIGFVSVGTTYYFGQISEMIFYSRALTDQERQGVEAYLSKKWGIKLG